MKRARSTTREERLRRNAMIRSLYRMGWSAIILSTLTGYSRQRIHQICQDSLHLRRFKKPSP